MRFLQAILMAMLKLAEGGMKGLEWLWRFGCGFLPGAGGGGTMMPPARLNLPDADEAQEAKEAAADQQRASDYILSSPARVALAWARASKQDRDTIPLTKLTAEQVDWLEVHLSDAQLKALATEKSEFKVADALAGREDVIFGVPSVGQIKKRKSDPVIADRIEAFRAGGLERPPAFVH